jgi:hypothetical protein
MLGIKSNQSGGEGLHWIKKGEEDAVFYLINDGIFILVSIKRGVRGEGDHLKRESHEICDPRFSISQSHLDQ